jgi:hypothetical protein
MSSILEEIETQIAGLKTTTTKTNVGLSAKPVTASPVSRASAT